MISFLSIGMILYIIGIILFLYYSFFVDPNQSIISKYITQIIPNTIWNKICKRIFNKRIISILEFFSDRFLMVLYCFIVFGSWTIVYMYIYPWIDIQQQQNYGTVSTNNKIIGYIVFTLAIVSWRVSSQTSPGIITKRNIQYYNHYPYDNLLYIEGMTCRTYIGLPKLARSKFDRYRYNANIPKYDHFCGWVYNTIGEENYRWFLLFLLVHVIMMIYGTIIISLLFYNEIQYQNLLHVLFFDKLTGQEIIPTKWIIIQYLFHKYIMESSLLLLMCVMSIAVGIFLFYHVYITSIGMTTNEASKWDHIMKWYKNELQKYNTAMKSGTLQSSDSNNNNNNSPSKDNHNCIHDNKKDPSVRKNNNYNNNDNHQRGTIEEMQHDEVNHTNKDNNNNNKRSTNNNVTTHHDYYDNNDENNDDNDECDENEIRHPGPKPIFIYNKGFMQNWKEVFFPISLQKYTESQKQQQQERIRMNQNKSKDT